MRADDIFTSSTSTTNGEYISRYTGSGGTYYVRVYGSGSGSCNRYDLDIWTEIGRWRMASLRGRPRFHQVFRAGPDQSGQLRTDYAGLALGIDAECNSSGPPTQPDILLCSWVMLELSVALMGEHYDVDAFDQPGVEAGKIAAYALMGRAGYEERRAEIEAATTATPRVV